MESIQSLFISHASSDKQDYVLPLIAALTARKVTFWLDSLEMTWGDNIAMKINEGLRNSRYILLCLSENFLKRPWPESEMNTALAMQNEKGMKKVLPLILNSKESVLKNYPIISGLAYREYGAGIDKIADELAMLTGMPESSEGKLRVIIESTQTGQVSNLLVTPRVSVGWLIERARIGAGLKDAADVGSVRLFRVQWILVDAQAEAEWHALPRAESRRIRALVKSKSGIKISYDEKQRLENIDVYDGITFHLYAVEDYDIRMTSYCR